jgi:capsid portal protein
MQLLKSLKLVHYEHSTHRNPRLHRRHKLLAKLAEQIELAQDSAYQPTKTQFVADAEGNMQQVQRSKRIRRWWNVKADGTVQLTIRYGSKPLELAKGKNAVEIASEAELVGTLEQIRAAVEQGELDELIEAQAAWRNRVNTIKAEKLS